MVEAMSTAIENPVHHCPRELFRFVAGKGLKYVKSSNFKIQVFVATFSSQKLAFENFRNDAGHSTAWIYEVNEGMQLI